MNNNILQITAEEQALRVAKLRLTVPTLIVDNADLFYLTGRVFAGYLYLAPGEAPKYFCAPPLGAHRRKYHLHPQARGYR